MNQGDRVHALIGDKWVIANYEKPLTIRGREGQHVVMLDDGHAAIALEVLPV